MAEFLEVGKDARAEQVHMDEKGHHTTESSSNVGGSDVSELIHDPKDWVNLRFCWQFFNVSLIWMLYGYDVQFVGSLLGLPYFVSRFQGPNSAGLLVFNARNLNLLLPVSVCGTALAPFVTPFVVDKMGRKKTLLFAFGFCCVPSSFLQLFAPNISALAVGRLWNYFGISMAEQVAAPFTAEIVPAKYRSTFLGASVGINQLTGIAATAIMYGCSHLVGDKQWKIPLAIQAGLPAILFIVTLTSLESPTWLISKGRIDEATTVQSKLRPAHRKDLVRAEIANLVAAYEEDKNMKKGNFWELFSKRHLKRTITSALASACTACSGYSLTATYGVTILIASGVSDPFKWQIGTATLAFAGQMVGSYAYDRVGRRLMIVGGYISILVLDFLCGGIATTGLKTTSQGKALASFSIILSFFANVTFAAIYVLQTEIPTLSLRSYTIAYSTFWNAVATIISYFVSPYLLTAPANLGAKTYLIFGGFMVLATIAAYLLIPETSNRTWVEIDELYDKKVPAWKWKGYQCESVQAVSATAQKMEQQGH